MNDNQTVLMGKGEWTKMSDGTYSKSVQVHYKNGRVDTHLIEQGVTEKEYFKRKLMGQHKL